MANIVESPSLAELDWPELDAILAELATLSRADISPQSLAAELLDRTVRLLAAVGGAIWLMGESGSMKLLHQVGHTSFGPHTNEARQQTRAAVIVSGAVEITSLPASGERRGAVSAQEMLLIVCPVICDRAAAGLIEIFQRAPIDEDALRGNRRFLELVGQTAGDYLWRRELRSLRQLRSKDQDLVELVEKVHRSLSLTAVAFELANEGRKFVGCDRLSVATRQGGSFRMLAISGVDTIDRRSSAVLMLEKLVRIVAPLGAAFWSDENEADLPPQIAGPLQSYLEESHARSCGIVPIWAPSVAAEGEKKGLLHAVLVVEQFGGVANRVHRAAAELVARHGHSALLNALRFKSLPTLPFARQSDLFARRALVRSGWVWAAMAAACCFAALVFVRVDYGVLAEGKLQPVTRQEVFAPMAGRVVRLDVRHGEQVKAGSVLFELTSAESDVDLQRVQGEYDTTRKRLSVVESSLLQAGAAKERDSMRAAQLAAEQEELTHLLNSQRSQLEVLVAERKKLAVSSPIDGAVLTWDVEQLLKDRPVERGQSLVTIGDLSGRWAAEIEIPHDRAGEVLAAESADRPLPVTFQLATDRGREFHGTMRRISNRTEANEDHRQIVRAVVDFDARAMHEHRPGATVFARVHCGRKPLAYVWFHQLFETLRGWAFYWMG